MNVVGDYPAGENIFSESPVIKSLSFMNDFVPLYALFNGRVIQNGETKALMYQWGTTAGSWFYSEYRINNFLSHLFFPEVVWNNLMYKSTIAGITCPLHVGRGILIKNYTEPLVLLTVRSRYTFKMDRSNWNKDYLCILLNKELLNTEDPEMAKVYRNLKRTYIDEVVSQGYSIMWATKESIMDMCFKDSETLNREPQAPTIIELRNEVNKIGTILHDYYIHNG